MRARRETDRLFDLVSEATLYSRPVPQRHRLIFYVGHIDAFDWNLLGADERRFDPVFDKLFEFGIDPGSDALPMDKGSDWPAWESVRRYCLETRRRVDDLLEHAGREKVQTALEHRLMHAETLAYLLHNLPCNFKIAPSARARPPALAYCTEWCDVPEGEAVLGRAEEFGWDNEFEAQAVQVPAFRVSRYKITNREYLTFVNEGGAPPPFWELRGKDWYRRGMFETVPLPPGEPVYTTQAQAAGYAAFKGKRLLTEAEFHRAAMGANHAAANFEYWDAIPVSASPGSASQFGVEQLIGNGWEWTSTVFAPFPGFTPRPYYPGYSRDFFNGDHLVLKGGSTRTAHRLLRRSFRNWFRRDYPYAYAGFRLVEGA